MAMAMLVDQLMVSSQKSCAQEPLLTIAVPIHVHGFNYKLNVDIYVECEAGDDDKNAQMVMEWSAAKVASMRGRACSYQLAPHPNKF